MYVFHKFIQSQPLWHGKSPNVDIYHHSLLYATSFVLFYFSTTTVRRLSAITLYHPSACNFLYTTIFSHSIPNSSQFHVPAFSCSVCLVWSWSLFGDYNNEKKNKKNKQNNSFLSSSPYFLLHVCFLVLSH